MAFEAVKAGASIGSKLIPPRDANPEHVYNYRVAVSLSLMGVIMGTGFHIAWACGFLAFAGLSGFARADDVSDQKAQLTTIERNQTERDIRDAKRQICLAQQTRNQPALSSWSIQLDNLRGQYVALTHQQPYVMSCDELLISAAGPSSP